MDELQYVNNLNALRRAKGSTNQEFFWYLLNRLGVDVCIAHNYVTAEGGVGFSKWMTFLSLLEYAPDEYIPSVYMTRDEFISKATHRQVLDIEILVDIDEPGHFISIKSKAESIGRKLYASRVIFSASFSGSKSYHISILAPELRDLHKVQRHNEKSKLISQWLTSDGLKASERNMIALEGVPHWKTGVVKQEVDL